MLHLRARVFLIEKMSCESPLCRIWRVRGGGTAQAKRDSALLTGYLFRQWMACVRVPNWKNKCPGSQRCCKMCMVTSATYTRAGKLLLLRDLGILSNLST